MQTELLFELTYILLERKSVTASEMAEHFGVSQRTIYRWVDALDLAGVPVITSKGKGGGISLSEKYTLDKTILTEEEKFDILSSVQAFQVLSGNKNTAVSKLKALTKTNTEWIKIDFSPWNPKGAEIRDLFNLLKNAILNRRQIEFSYYSSKGECSKRKADPWKIIFKGQAWYLYGFCHQKSEPRYFKLNRIKDCVALPQEILNQEPEVPEDEKNYSGYREDDCPLIKLKLYVTNSCIFRILDEYKIDNISSGNDENHKIITMEMPDIYWLINWLLSFGSELKVLEPEEIQVKINNEISKMYKDIY